MNTIVLVLMMAVTVEALIKYVKTVIGAVQEGEARTAVTQLAAVLLSVLLCFAVGAAPGIRLGAFVRFISSYNVEY